METLDDEDETLACYLVRCIDLWYESHPEEDLRSICTALDDVRQAAMTEALKWQHRELF
jgi:hypothetical protein